MVQAAKIKRAVLVGRKKRKKEQKSWKEIEMPSALFAYRVFRILDLLSKRIGISKCQRLYVETAEAQTDQVTRHVWECCGCTW